MRGALRLLVNDDEEDEWMSIEVEGFEDGEDEEDEEDDDDDPLPSSPLFSLLLL